MSGPRQGPDIQQTKPRCLRLSPRKGIRSGYNPILPSCPLPLQAVGGIVNFVFTLPPASSDVGSAKSLFPPVFPQRHAPPGSCQRALLSFHPFFPSWGECQARVAFFRQQEQCLTPRHFRPAPFVQRLVTGTQTLR